MKQESLSQKVFGKEGKWGEYPHKDFPDVVKEAEVDAVIALVGG